MLALFLGKAPATTSQTNSEPRPPEHLDQVLPERQSRLSLNVQLEIQISCNIERLQDLARTYFGALFATSANCNKHP